MSTSKRWLLVVDTDTYAGNFERELCAHLTAQVGECEVGANEADTARQTMPADALKWCEENITQEPDDHGCHRPVKIRPTPGWFNDGAGNHWREGADPEAVKAKYLESVRADADRTRKVYADKEYGAKEAERILAERTEPGHYDAYNSIEVYLTRQPPEWLFQLWVARTAAFFEGDNVQVAAVRVVVRTTTVMDRDFYSHAA